ncbi:MAG TPA: hypothetical protein VGP07_17030 [Polyangia bacterium]|jgi:hypothetical protein
MTPDVKSGEDRSVDNDREETEPGVGPVYEAPVLVPLGNVHALLASTGTSPTSDGGKGGMRNAGG